MNGSEQELNLLQELIMITQNTDMKMKYQELYDQVLNRKTIVIEDWALSEGNDVSFGLCDSTPELVQAIENYMIENQDILDEVFHKQDNIIITSKGYFGAFFKDEIVHANK